MSSLMGQQCVHKHSEVAEDKTAQW